MKFIYYSLSLFLLFNIQIIAQPEIEWQTNLGGSEVDNSISIFETSDGGYVSIGSSRSSDVDVSNNLGSLDVWIVKLDNSGNIIWEHNYGGSSEDLSFEAQQTLDGGYIIASSSYSNDGDVGGNFGDRDYWILRIDDLGNILWQKNYGGSGDDFISSIVPTSDGGYIGAGASDSNDGNVTNSIGSKDFWIVKLDNSGYLEWERSLGGSLDDIANSIIETSDGGFIVAGQTKSSDNQVSINKGASDYWIVKLDSNRNFQWEKSYGGSNEDIPTSIIQTIDGGYMVSGYTKSDDGDVSVHYSDFDVWMVKTDANGNLEWEKNLGGLGPDLGNSIYQIEDEGYIIAGFSASNTVDVSSTNGGFDAWILKTDATGNLEWEDTYGGTSADTAYGFQQTSDGGFIFSGESRSDDGDGSDNHGKIDAWVVKLSPISTSVNQNSKKLPSISIHPNPSSGNLVISLEDTRGPAHANLYNILGQLVFFREINGPSAQINGITQGVYWLVVSTEEWTKTMELIVTD